MLMYKDGEPLRDLRTYYSKDGASQSVEVGASLAASPARYGRVRRHTASDATHRPLADAALLLLCCQGSRASNCMLDDPCCRILAGP